ncbi:MAG: hypothetical protein JW934_13460 [Anaerolineae bacterium]|nr:hypothetical protein [Anaerolineae bacterium]
MAQTPPCPYCGGAEYRRPDKNMLICTACEHEFDIREDLCRACGHLNRAEAVTCAHCSAKLNKADLATAVISARTRTRQDWQAERLETARQQKVEEEEASKRRMDAYWEEEREHQRLVAARLAEKRARERKILIGMLIAVGGLVLIALGALIVSILL